MLVDVFDTTVCQVLDVYMCLTAQFAIQQATLHLHCYHYMCMAVMLPVANDLASKLNALLLTVLRCFGTRYSFHAHTQS